MNRLLKPFVGVMLVILVVAGCAPPAAPVAPTAVPPTAIPATPTTVPPTPAPVTADPLDVAQVYADAMAKGDADTALALFSDNAKIVDDEGNTSAAGRDAIRDYLAWLRAHEYREIAVECTDDPNPNVIECHGQTRTVLVPVGEAPITYNLKVEDGRIVSVHIIETHWDAVATAHANAFFEWFRATHSDDYQRFIDLFNQRAYNRQLVGRLA